MKKLNESISQFKPTCFLNFTQYSNAVNNDIMIISLYSVSLEYIFSYTTSHSHVLLLVREALIS